MDAAPEIGWHQSEADPAVSHYWDGHRWSGELQWDGSEWTQPVSVSAAPAATPPVLVAPPAPAPAPVPSPSLDGVIRAASGLSATAKVLIAGCCAATISVFLPWIRASNPYESRSIGPSSVGIVAVLLLAMVGAAAGFGASARLGSLSIARIIGLGASVTVMAMTLGGALLMLVWLGSEAEEGAVVGLGSGLFLWAVGTVLLAIGCIRAWRERSVVETEVVSS